MAKETTGEFAAEIMSPVPMKITIIRLSAEEITFESPQKMAVGGRVKVRVHLGTDRYPTEGDVEVISSEDVGSATLCDARWVDLGSPARRRIVMFVDDLVREEYLKEVPPGTELFKEGEESRHIYYIALGTFVVDKGGEKIAEITQEDQFVGEISFLLNTPRTATVTAMTESMVMAIPAEVFQKSLSTNPKLAVELSRLLAKRLVSTSQNYARTLNNT